MPRTPVVGFDTQNDGNDLNDRAMLNGKVAARNSLRQPAFADLDLRVVKDITLPARGSTWPAATHAYSIPVVRPRAGWAKYPRRCASRLN